MKFHSVKPNLKVWNPEAGAITIRFEGGKYETLEEDEIALLKTIDGVAYKGQPLDDDEHKCGVCGKVCKSEFALTSHMRSHETSVNPREKKEKE